MLRPYAAIGLFLLAACANEPYRVLSSTASICADCRYSCEPSFAQDEPISIRVEECVFESPDVRIETEEFEFSDGILTLTARSYASTPEEVDVLGRRSSHETDALSKEELESPLLKSAVKFLRTRGKVRINLLTPDSFPGREPYYDPLPPPRPAA